MSLPRSPTSFFQPPRLYALTAAVPVAQSYVRGTGYAPAGLGDWATDLLSTVNTGVMDLVDTFTGKRSERLSQEKATQMELARQQANIQMQKTRSAGWKEATPWLVAGGTALGLGILAAVVRRRG